MARDDVRFRIGAEGDAAVVAALGKIRGESARTAKAVESIGGRMTGALRGAHGLLLQLGAAVGVASLTALIKGAGDAADEVGKMSQRIGSSVENLSALRLGAETADVPLEKLAGAFVIFNRKARDLANGSKEATAAFAKLGITAEQFRGLDAAERFDLVARALARLKDSPEKTALAFDIFGKQAAALIPLLNDLGENGLEALKERARGLGLLFSDETARAAQAVNDDFTIIKLQTQALAQQFILGLAPGLHAALTDVQGSLGQSTSSFQEWGAAVGRTIGILILTAEGFADRMVTSLKKIANAGGALIKAFKTPATAAAEFFAVTRINEQLERDFEKRQAARGDRAERIGEQTARGIEGLPELRSGAQDEDAPFENAIENADKLKREIETLEEQRDRFIAKQLEAEGQRHEVAMRNIEQESQRFAETLRALEAKGKPQGDIDARVAAFREALTLAEAFRVEQATANAELAAIDQARATIKAQIQANLLTEAEGEAKLLALEKERLPKLQAIAAALQAAAAATKDPEALEAAAKFSQAITEMAISTQRTAEQAESLSKTIGETLLGSLTEFFTTGIRESKNLLDAVRTLALGITQALQQVFARQLAIKLLESFGFGFSEGGPVERRAEGGFISGPGTSTSDSIPALLSDGEYVVRAAAVKRPGVLSALDAINRGGVAPALFAASGARRFADGGLVSGAGASTLNGSIAISLDRGLILEEISGDEGTRRIIKAISRHPRATRAALGGG